MLALPSSSGEASSSAAAALADDGGEEKALALPSSSGAASSSAAAAPADAGGWSVTDELVGRSANFISEKISHLFQRSVKIMAIKGGDLARVSPDHLPHKVEVRVEDLDLLPRLLDNPEIRKGVLSRAHLEEAKLRFGDGLSVLKMADCLTDQHLMIGVWIIQRDMPGAVQNYMVQPQIAWSFYRAVDVLKDHAGAEEMRQKAEVVLQRRFRRSALLGVPICEAGHWTLLCFRRSAIGLHIRYYDSLKNVQADCLKAAQKIVQLLSPGAVLSEKSNASVQTNAVDCGVYSLHYWEMEIRRLEGYGWQGSWPQNNKEIKSRKLRLINIMEQIKAYIDAPPAPAKKKKEIVVDPLPPLEEDDKSRVVKEIDLKLMSLADLAKKAADQGSVPFYGCSRCRWIRSGCISYKCNPEKFLKHFEKFPEKYVKGEKVLLKQIAAKMPGHELLGGGVPVQIQIFVFLFPNSVSACFDDSYEDRSIGSIRRLGRGDKQKKGWGGEINKKKAGEQNKKRAGAGR